MLYNSRAIHGNSPDCIDVLSHLLSICKVDVVAGSWLDENASVDVVRPEHDHGPNKRTLGDRSLYGDQS